MSESLNWQFTNSNFFIDINLVQVNLNVSWGEYNDWRRRLIVLPFVISICCISIRQQAKKQKAIMQDGTGEYINTRQSFDGVNFSRSYI